MVTSEVHELKCCLWCKWYDNEWGRASPTHTNKFSVANCKRHAPKAGSGWPRIEARDLCGDFEQFDKCD